MTATGSNLQRCFSSDAPSESFGQNEDLIVLPMFVTMASNACHILEAALEQMDDMIAGKSYSPHYLKNTAASFVIAGLRGYEKCGLTCIQIEILDSQVRKGDQPVLFCNGSDIFLVLVRVINQKLWYLR